MIDTDLRKKLDTMELQDIFDTLKPFWKKALNWERMSMDEWAGEGYTESLNSPCAKYANSILPCPECEHKTEIINVCTASPFYKKGFRSLVICESEDCTYNEYRKETMPELVNELKEVDYAN